MTSSLENRKSRIEQTEMLTGKSGASVQLECTEESLSDVYEYFNLKKQEIEKVQKYIF